ncbi:MAG: STAS domain-containing protein [Saprospiraceae bacterium]|nr:STAS domain-containing protein [Saprospiraceae bacterium]
MKFSIDKKELFVVFKLEENKLNTLHAPDLKSELVVLNAEGYRNMVLDLSEVSFVDSSGLSAILVAHRLCKDAGGTFIIAAPQENVKRLITISQLDSILTSVPSVQEAADYIKMDELEREMSSEE